MRQLWDFPGGIHPPENKRQSLQQPIRPAGLPDILMLPLHQHIGAPARPLVTVGDTVLKGQKIAEAEDGLSLPVHAPTSGRVTAIEDRQVPHPSGMTDQCILIEPDGEERWDELTSCEDYHELKRHELLRRIHDAGLAGLGGAGFPTYIKLHPPGEDKVETLILNGAECEPYITADQILMAERADEVVKGLEIMAYILEPSACVIAVEDNKPDAITALRKAVEGTRIEVTVIPTKYPSGGERQLIQILTGKEVPHGGIPADIGVMCQNVGTAAAVYRAIRFGEPLISRITTLTGEALTSPGNFETLIGTPIRYLLQQAGFAEHRTERLIMGGPMMGFTLEATMIPVVKTTNCLIAATLEEFPAPPPAQPCIRCGMCEQVCPAELLPQQLYWFAKGQELEKAEQFDIFDCIECGACAYVCPSTIPLVQYYRYAKGEIRQQRADQLKSDRARERFEQRQERLEREKAEKEARRKARAEAAAKAQAEKAAGTEEKPASKADAVKAAVARAQAKKPVAATADVATLKSNLEKAEAKLEKMREALADAQQNDPTRIEKLQNAVAKNEQRVNVAREALSSAEDQQTPKSEPKESIDTLRKNAEKARAKLAQMESLLAEAGENNPDQVEKLTRAVEKNRHRVDKAEMALADGQKKTSTPPAPVKTVEQAEADLAKAQQKLAQMEDFLADARENKPEQVEKFQRAVQKNQDRVAKAEQALADARSANNAVSEQES